MVRKERLRPGMTKIDLVVTSARYDGETGRVSQARAYERWGQVWSDILLLDRSDLVERINAGKKVVTGGPVGLPGEFDVDRSVRLADGKWLVADGGSPGRDDLGVPTY
ncbi:MAG TPA: hypothetical protein VLL77_08900 [Anaerolineales bacterium]|nr:hypothetical protein [Anaerolineales bacterium]